MSTPPVLLSEAELDDLATRSQRSIDNPKVPMLVPARLIAQLVAGYRHHRDEGTNAIVGDVTSSDALDDVAERLDFARSALALIARGGTVAETQTEAKQAIRADDAFDEEMRPELGFGLDRLGRYVRKPVPRAREPRHGEHRRDMLGNVWRIVRDADPEDDGEVVRLELLQPAGTVRTDDLMSVSERVAKRPRRRKVG